MKTSKIIFGILIALSGISLLGAGIAWLTNKEETSADQLAQQWNKGALKISLILFIISILAFILISRTAK